MGAYIIGLIAEDKTGKTSVLNNVWDLLPCYNSVDKKEYYKLSHEIVGHVELYSNNAKAIHREFKVGINSFGDSVDDIRRGLVELLYSGCDIIICAARKTDDLLEAIHTLTSTVITSRMTKNASTRGVSKYNALDDNFLPMAQSLILNYELIVTSHLQKYIEPTCRRAISKKLYPASDMTPLKVEEIVGNVNLTRLSAQHIVDLVERLIN